MKFMTEKQPTSARTEVLYLVPLPGIHAQTWRCIDSVWSNDPLYSVAMYIGSRLVLPQLSLFLQVISRIMTTSHKVWGKKRIFISQILL